MISLRVVLVACFVVSGCWLSVIAADPKAPPAGAKKDYTVVTAVEISKEYAADAKAADKKYFPFTKYALQGKVTAVEISNDPDPKINGTFSATLAGDGEATIDCTWSDRFREEAKKKVKVGDTITVRGSWLGKQLKDFFMMGDARFAE